MVFYADCSLYILLDSQCENNAMSSQDACFNDVLYQSSPLLPLSQFWESIPSFTVLSRSSWHLTWAKNIYFFWWGQPVSFHLHSSKTLLLLFLFFQDLARICPIFFGKSQDQFSYRVGLSSICLHVYLVKKCILHILIVLLCNISSQKDERWDYLAYKI